MKNILYITMIIFLTIYVINIAIGLDINTGIYTQTQLDNINIDNINIQCTNYITKLNPAGFIHYGIQCNRIKPYDDRHYEVYEFKFGVIVTFDEYFECRDAGYSKNACIIYVNSIARDDAKKTIKYIKDEYRSYQSVDYNLDITPQDMLVGDLE